MASKPANEPRRARPWHERLPLLGWFRNRLRNALFRRIRDIAATDDGRDMLVSALEGVFAGRTRGLEGLDAEPLPYPDLGAAGTPDGADGAGAIFITGRFRSGSTLLWNLFRHLNGFTAYYEPHNERRWFDPATRGSHTDPSHRHVTDYWAEYAGLGELARYYREEWTRRRLFMDEDSWDPDLLQYTRILLARAKGRAVLQCNRIDFRLAWFRRHFPRAQVIHLYRHPRDQWCSSLLDVTGFPPDGTVWEFRSRDGFYLLPWARDLRDHFPFLDERAVEHPYQLFYYIWKLSYLFGRRYADHSLSMEGLVTNPEAELLALFGVLKIDPEAQDLAKLRGLIAKPEMGKWRKYAAEDWFVRHESACEETLADFFQTVRDRPGAAERKAPGAPLALLLPNGEPPNGK
jgi:hypothetical protein